MGVTGIGSSYNFVYNTSTSRISTKDGSKSEFVDFCNGDVRGEDTETLNHFDAHTRYQFERMKFVASLYGDSFDGKEEVEIKADIESATKTQFYVDGNKSFRAYTGMSYLPSELKMLVDLEQPFATRESKPYDPKTNSISIGVGSQFDLGNGYSITVMDNYVKVDGYKIGDEVGAHHADFTSGGLDALIHFADQQWFAGMTDEYTGEILEFLQSQGVDTSREFTINGTHCELVNGKIREVGNDYGVPSSMQQKAIERYEKSMADLLKEGNHYYAPCDWAHNGPWSNKA